MFHTPGQWVASPATAASAAAPSFGRREDRLNLIVDLGSDLFSGQWWRGIATLTVLCSTAALLAPGFAPLSVVSAQDFDQRDRHQQDALAIAPLSAGSATGLRMAPTDSAAPIDVAPERAVLDQNLVLSAGDGLAQLLGRAGASPADAARAAALIRSAAPSGLSAGTEIVLRLGRRTPGGSRPIEALALKAGIDARLSIARDSAETLRLVRHAIPVDNRPLRFRGRVGSGLYWSLRTAGVSPQLAADYLKVLSGSLDVGADIGAEDRFDLVVANRRSATGESRTGPLLYAGVDRFAGNDLRLVRWPVGGRAQWVDAAGIGRRSESAMAWPVAAPITSSFGYRIHPILRFARFHRGVDFGARWGTPIVAAADGQVIGAGWAGGYGRQVRLAHGGGIITTYSHMSRMTAEPGTLVRQGDVIGYVGSSGLSTGPHLHYEVYRGGRAVNPLSVRLASQPMLDGTELDAFKARLKALMSVGAVRS